MADIIVQPKVLAGQNPDTYNNLIMAQAQNATNAINANISNNGIFSKEFNNYSSFYSWYLNNISNININSIIITFNPTIALPISYVSFSNSGWSFMTNNIQCGTIHFGRLNLITAPTTIGLSIDEKEVVFNGLGVFNEQGLNLYSSANSINNTNLNCYYLNTLIQNNNLMQIILSYNNIN